MAKLSLSDIDKTQEGGLKRFNTISAMSEIVDASKLIMFTHKARYVDVIAAKDTGKSFPLDAYKIYGMEKDPKASAITLMKYSTKSGSKGIRSMSAMLGKLSNSGFKFPQNYEPSTGFFYRLPKNKKMGKDLKTKMASQFIQYSSFEDSDDLAGFTVANGGYPFLIHIEEPVMQNDSKQTSDKQWDADIKTIEDTIYRHYRDYAATNPYHEPIPFKIITTMNDWDPDHKISKRAEAYFPQMEFLDWCLGFQYSKHLSLWIDKIVDSETVVKELKDITDKNWEEIKKNVLINNTGARYVERGKTGKLEDRLIIRMQKFANPANRASEIEIQSVYEEMYAALITGDSLGLAKAFGLGYDGGSELENRFVINKFIPKDTEKILNEPGRRLLGFSMGWDHDANRGPVGTPVTLSAIPVQVGNMFEPRTYYKDVKLLIHDATPYAIEGYGKGENGHNTKLYHKQMIELSKLAYEKYVGNNGRELEYGKFIIFDDDDGSYTYKLEQPLREIGYKGISILPNKNGKIETGGFGVPSRDGVWQTSLDINDMEIDKKNIGLITWIKQCPVTTGTTGEKKRSTAGKWGKRFKDISNSAEYAWYPWAKLLMDGLNEY